MAAETRSSPDYRLRAVQQIVHGQETSDGAGVNMRRIIASPELDMLDPFLLLDAFSSETRMTISAASPLTPIAALRRSLTCWQARCSTETAPATKGYCVAVVCSG